MTAKMGRVPGTGVRVVHLPGVVVAAVTPEADAAPEIPYVVLDSRMRDDFRHARCYHDDHMQFTIPGWQAFVAAVKAGEFDHLRP